MKFFSIIISLLISLITSVGTVYVYDHYFKKDGPRIVSVDLTGFLAEQRKLYVSGEIDEETLKKRLQKVDKIISSIPEGTIVLLSDAVVKGTEVIDIGIK